MMWQKSKNQEALKANKWIYFIYIYIYIYIYISILQENCKEIIFFQYNL